MRVAQLINALDRESRASHCMDIHINPRISKQISIKAWIIEDWYTEECVYPFMGIYCLRISVAECPCVDINMDIHTCIDTWRHIQKSWISMLISVDFWKSMYGYAMDSLTRVQQILQDRCGGGTPGHHPKSLKNSWVISVTLRNFSAMRRLVRKDETPDWSGNASNITHWSSTCARVEDAFYKLRHTCIKSLTMHRRYSKCLKAKA